MIGPLTTAPAGFTHILVAVDKFTKWIEFKPITIISSDKAVNFIYDILYRFSFPHTIIQIWDQISPLFHSGNSVRTLPLMSNMF